VSRPDPTGGSSMKHSVSSVKQPRWLFEVM
jgi:hypothetical protein